MNDKDESQYRNFSKYFDSTVHFLKLTGFWIYDDDKECGRIKKYSQISYNIFWFSYLFVAYFPAEMLYLFCSFRDLNEFLRSLRDIGNHVSLGYKAFNYFITRKDILEIIVVLQSEDYIDEEYKKFRPKTIIRQEKAEALRWTKYFFNFCNAICLSMFLNGIFTFIFSSEKQYVSKNDSLVYGQEQPVKTVSPFGSGTKKAFILTFIYTMMALTGFAWMIVALDSLFITLMSCLSAHLKILRGAFKTLRARCVARVKMNKQLKRGILRDPENLQAETRREMIRCIRHLQTILRVSKKLERIYSTQTFVQTFISMGEMCFSLYLLSEAADASVGNEIAYLLATGFELLMYCWFGNRITEASVQLSYSLYGSDWFSTNLSFRKCIILTMTRMQKPIYVTVGKITPLMLSTFLMIARGAYSFFTFLKQRRGISD